MEEFDLIIIGAGPAGLSAGLTASYMKLKHLIIDANLAGGALIQSYPWKKVDSYLGYSDKTGQEISGIMHEHVEMEGSKIKEKEPVNSIKNKEKYFLIETEKSEYKAKSVIIATGIAGTPRKLGIPGEECSRVHYSIKNPNLYEGEKVLVVGGGDSAVEAAFALANGGADISIAHRRDVFRCTEKNTCRINESRTKILFNTEARKIKEENKRIKSVVLFDNIKNKEYEEKFDDVFFFVGSVIDLGYIKGLDVKMEGNKIIVDDNMQTSVKGLFAAGDITGRLLRIPEAIGEGHMAVYSAFKYLRNPYWAK